MTWGISSEPLQFPFVFWIDILECLSRRTIIIFDKQSVPSILDKILFCHVVPVILGCVSKTNTQPIQIRFARQFILPFTFSLWDFGATCFYIQRPSFGDHEQIY